MVMIIARPAARYDDAAGQEGDDGEGRRRGQSGAKAPMPPSPVMSLQRAHACAPRSIGRVTQRRRIKVMMPRIETQRCRTDFFEQRGRSALVVRILVKSGAGPAPPPGDERAGGVLAGQSPHVEEVTGDVSAGISSGTKRGGRSADGLCRNGRHRV